MGLALWVIGFALYALVLGYSLRYWGPAGPSGSPDRWRLAMVVALPAICLLGVLAALSPNNIIDVSFAVAALTWIVHVLGAAFSSHAGPPY